MSTMVNLGIGFQFKSLFCSSTPQHGGYTNSSLLEGDVKVRKVHAMLFLRNWLSRKWICEVDHSLQNNSGNRDNKTYVFKSYFADEDVYRRFEKHNYVLSVSYTHLTLPTNREV